MRADDWLKACSYQIPDAVGRSAIKVATILTMLNELSTLDVNLHLKIVQETFDVVANRFSVCFFLHTLHITYAVDVQSRAAQNFWGLNFQTPSLSSAQHMNVNQVLGP